MYLQHLLCLTQTRDPLGLQWKNSDRLATSCLDYQPSTSMGMAWGWRSYSERNTTDPLSGLPCHDILVDGLEHSFIFPYGNSHPNWRIIFSEGGETTNHISKIRWDFEASRAIRIPEMPLVICGTWGIVVIVPELGKPGKGIPNVFIYCRCCLD